MGPQDWMAKVAQSRPLPWTQPAGGNRPARSLWRIVAMSSRDSFVACPRPERFREEIGLRRALAKIEISWKEQIAPARSLVRETFKAKPSISTVPTVPVSTMQRVEWVSALVVPFWKCSKVNQPKRWSQMRRLIVPLISFGLTLAIWPGDVRAQATDGPRLQLLSVPASQARSLATKLSLRYRDVSGVQISPDPNHDQLVVMAPEAAQKNIAADLQNLLEASVQQASAVSSRPLSFQLKHITWREFEDDLARVVGRQHMPVTTSRNGERAAFQLTATPLEGTTIEVDRRQNLVTVIAPQPILLGWKTMIMALDQSPLGRGTVTEVVRLQNADPAPIQRALRLLQALEKGQLERGQFERGQSGRSTRSPLVAKSPFRNAVFQQDANAPQNTAPQNGAQNNAAEGADPAAQTDGGAGVIGDTQIQFVPELGTIIIRGSERDVQRVMDVIKEIEEKSKLTAPDVEVLELKHTDSNAVAALLQQLYEDVLSARQGDVSITSLDVPNALLLIGRTEAIQGLKELIIKIDQPVKESSRLRVFRLKNASAVDAEQTLIDFFSDRPGSSDDIRPGLGPRIRVVADYRTNSLIISAAPRDMVEITRLINELDVQEHSAQTQIKIFPLNNAIADDLAPVLQAAINGEGDGGANDNLTAPSTTLSIVAVANDGEQIVDSGIIVGAVVTADPGANAIVVRAKASSMPLIAELIRQLDQAPGIDSLVKVFTIQNGDAAQLTTALQTLFGADAGTVGTSVGAGNLAGLPSSTAGGESSLVPLNFSTDIRTNSIIASGGEEDLEVVESILLRLDSEGFAERITEVIWLRHQTAENVSVALQDYVQQRVNGVNRIQQFQQGGLGPYDLPDRDLVVTFEGATNSLLISVSPRLYEEVRRLIDKLDRRPPMVLIKVLIAEVTLDDTFEIGGEVGLQDSLLYDRGIVSAALPPSNPGFLYNANGTPNINSFGKGTVAARGLSSFGVGATNSTIGYGGFVLSAASDSVSLLLRTLQEANRLQIISRPQIMTMDNTDGFVQVGRQIARVTGVVNNGVAGTQIVTEDIEVGLIMQVRPRVGADGLIVMDIDATRSDRDDDNGTLVPTGDVVGSVVLINDILRTTAQSTIAAYSGQTVVFGGLIQKTRGNFSRRVPFLADIPLLGYFFKYDQERERRTELLVIMTPMLVNGDEDMEYVKQVESSRMSYCLADVVEAHGDVGLSGGYGLWGPAVGNTIYPDMQPTIDHVIMQDSKTIAPAAPIVAAEDTMLGSEPTQTDLIPPTEGFSPAVSPPPSVPPFPKSIPETSQGAFLMPAAPNNSFPPATQSSRVTPTAPAATKQVSWMQRAALNQPPAVQGRPQPTRLGTSKR